MNFMSEELLTQTLREPTTKDVCRQIVIQRKWINHCIECIIGLKDVNKHLPETFPNASKETIRATRKDNLNTLRIARKLLRVLAAKQARSKLYLKYLQRNMIVVYETKQSHT